MPAFKKIALFSIFIISTITIGCNIKSQEDILYPVRPGADYLLITYRPYLADQTIGIVTNQTGRLSNGVHIVDTLSKWENFRVAAIFSPEHSFRGNISNGREVGDTVDDKTNIPIYSLYGKNKKPTPEMLKGITVMIFDIQDIGVRYYTYISTLYYLMEACAENDIRLLILDRPNPLSGSKVDGPVISSDFKSFVGIAPISIVHGMTIGELSLMFKDIIRERKGLKVNFNIARTTGWQRDDFFDSTGFNWIKTSPNIPDFETALIYPATCLLEGTNISEGRGTYSPFKMIGAPFINSNELISALDSLEIIGINYQPAEFTPVSIPGMAEYPKYKNKLCFGIKLTVTDKKLFMPVEFNVKLIYAIYNLYPDEFEFNEEWISLLFGNDYLHKMILAGAHPNEIISKWQNELNEFKKLRDNYLIYSN